MRIRLITLRYSVNLGSFDDSSLAALLKDKQLTAFREHFFSVNGCPHLLCILEYQEAVLPQVARDYAHVVPRSSRDSPALDKRDRRKAAPDPCEGLSEPERALFNRLREWRTELAHQEGQPPYIIFNNKQLVELVRRRPDSLTALGHIHGVGPAKLKKYGAAVLEHLHGSPSSDKTSTT